MDEVRLPEIQSMGTQIYQSQREEVKARQKMIQMGSSYLTSRNSTVVVRVEPTIPALGPGKLDRSRNRFSVWQELRPEAVVRRKEW